MKSQRIAIFEALSFLVKSRDEKSSERWRCLAHVYGIVRARAAVRYLWSVARLRVV